jgi:pantothenate kinase
MTDVRRSARDTAVGRAATPRAATSSVPAGDLDALVARAHSLERSDRRAILGIAGPPGAGKSTLAARLAGALGDSAVLVPMDGFHLAQSEIVRLGRSERKGAPDTFDVAGYLALLVRLRTRGHATVYAPEFRRELDEPIAGAIAVGSAHTLVVTEGNYLLDDGEGWRDVRGLLDEVWYVSLPEHERRRRLVARHESYGASPERARSHALGSDELNAARVRARRSAADLVVDCTEE